MKTEPENPRPLISVIIPVYNGERYVEEAVRSALHQPRDVEVILVEDGSTDGSLELCRRLAAQSRRVRLLQHRRGENRGPGASRNLGIRNARGRYVAFLDADDHYLPNRFDLDIDVMEADPSIEGVYGAVGTQFESGYVPMPSGDRELTTFDGAIEPGELFATMLLGARGSFCTLGITVRRSVFDKTAQFDEHLVLAQDSAMWLKMAATCKLVAGSIREPIAVRRRHAGNRTSVRNPHWHGAGCAYIWSVLRWGTRRPLEPKKIEQLRKGLALAIVGRREGAGVLGRAVRIVRRVLSYGFTYLPLVPEVGLLFVKKLLGRPRVEYSGGAAEANRRRDP